MKKRMQKMMKNEKGLTLVELLAVIVILGIIAAIAIPAIGSIVENSRIKAIKADAQNALSAANMYFIENSDKSEVLVSVLISEGFLQDAGSLVIDGTGTDVAKVAKQVPPATGGSTIVGKGKNGTTTVTFAEGSTSKAITGSKNNITVPAPAP